MEDFSFAIGGVKQEIKTDRYKCRICRKVYANRNSLSIHIKNKHKIANKYICPHCEYDYTTKADLQRHLEKKVCAIKTDKNGKAIIFNCKHCPREFGSKIALTLHMKRVHENEFGKFMCTVCEKKFGTRNHMKKHMRTIHSIKKYTCTFCDLKFNQEENLQAHIKTRHSDDATTRQQEKFDKLTTSQRNLNAYLACNLPNEVIRDVTNKTTEKYYLKLTTRQKCRIELYKMFKPKCMNDVVEVPHKHDYCFTFDKEDGTYKYQERIPDSEEFKVYCYVWRDGTTYEIIDVYIGLTVLTPLEATKSKWYRLVQWGNNKDTIVKGCSDRSLFEAGHFFCAEEAFFVDGLIADCKEAGQQLKWIARGESGSICSFNPKECYILLQRYLGQIKYSMRKGSDVWSKLRLFPDMTLDNLVQNEFHVDLKRYMDLVKGNPIENQPGLLNILLHVIPKSVLLHELK
ncbi:zinc finger protein 433 isoform X2 [Folsomia candida]|uniref:zinc finger protein 433 isoform X2 n=1 Tax=Folsomia candida TaxID=158441 RepID=UPI00160551E9|nr:zinc finger protein 433 isoform X2 [Folsomia candida]